MNMHTGISKVCDATRKKMGSLGTTLKLLHYDLVVIGSKHGNNLSTCRDKAVYICPSPDLTVARDS